MKMMIIKNTDKVEEWFSNFQIISYCDPLQNTALDHGPLDGEIYVIAYTIFNYSLLAVLKTPFTPWKAGDSSLGAIYAESYMQLVSLKVLYACIRMSEKNVAVEMLNILVGQIQISMKSACRNFKCNILSLQATLEHLCRVMNSDTQYS